jgi:Sulfatase
MEGDRPAIRWVAASLPLTALAATLYLFFEWLFFVTSPSPVGSLPILSQFEVLLESPVRLTPSLLVIQAAASLLSSFRYPRVRWIALVPAACLLGVLAMILLDNFTYTLFGIGIVTTGEGVRALYIGILAALIVFARQQLLKWFSAIFARQGVAEGALTLSTFFICASIPSAVTSVVVSGADATGAPSSPRDSSGPRPNILFVGIDGVDASTLSAYGYERETSPFLTSLVSDTLFFENAFPNVGRTHGSLISLLTGRLPFSTHVTFPPTVLQGEDAHRHLPGILRGLGYHTLQIGMRHYADAEDAHLLGGFDAANYRWSRFDDLQVSAAARDETQVFQAAVAERLSDRLGQMLGFKRFVSAFEHVQGRTVSPYWSDARRVETLVQYFGTAAEPWFVHAHLLDTHCCTYRPRNIYFSGDSRTAARDSQLKETDENLRILIEALAAAGRLEHTVVVFSSDHTSEWTTTGRVPLMIRFPNARPNGRVTENVQLSDVAPTVLQYLGVERPPWMDGVSLLNASAVPPERPIFALSAIQDRQVVAPMLKALSSSGPPNYGAASATAIIGNKWFELSLVDGTLRSGAVSGHTRLHLPVTLDSAARNILMQQLESNGFTVGLP